MLCAAAVVAGMLAFLYASMRQPRYNVSASIIILEDTPSGPMNLMSQLSLNNLLGGSSSVDNEEFVMNSHSVFESMVRSLGLNTSYIIKDGLRKRLQYPEAPVMMDCNPAIADTLMTGIKFKVAVNTDGKADITAVTSQGVKIGEMKGVALPANINTPLGDFNFFTTDRYVPGKKIKEIITYKSYSFAAEDYEKIVKIGISSKRADAISLTVTHVSPVLGKLILNGLIEAYNEKGSAEKQLRGETTINFIDKRIGQLSQQLYETEQSLSDYKRDHKLANINVDVTYSFEEHAALQREIVRAESELEMFNIVKERLQQNNNDDLLPELTFYNEPMPSIEKYNDMVMRRRELAKTARRGNQVLERLDADIASMRQNIIVTVDQKCSQLSASIAELKRKDNSSTARIGNVPAQERDLREIMRNQQIQEQIYVFLLEQREQQAMNSLNSLPRGIIVDAPYVMQKPAGIGRLLLTIIGLAVGLFASAGIYYLKFLWDNGLKG